MITRELVQKAYYRKEKPHTKTLQFSQRSKNAADKTRYGVKWQFLRHDSVDEGQARRFANKRLHLSKLQEHTVQALETENLKIIHTLDSERPEDILNTIRDEIMSNEGDPSPP